MPLHINNKFYWILNHSTVDILGNRVYNSGLFTIKLRVVFATISGAKQTELELI